MSALRATLPQVQLGHGLVVSSQGFGAMGLSHSYGTADEKQSLQTVNHAIDAGITLLDTANVYGDGHNERLLAKVLKHRRDEVVLATKTGIIPHAAPGAPKAQGDPAHIHRSIDESLTRLGVDEVDLYYYHRVDPRVPIEETVGAFSELVQAGKIKHIGLSEVTSQELQRAHRVHPITAVQSEYSLFSRDVEDQLLPAARRLGVGFVAYAPLGRGFISGQVQDPRQLAEADARRNFPRFSPGHLEKNLDLLATITAVAASERLTNAQVALAWLASRGLELGLGIVPIPGTRSAARIDENLAALGNSLSNDSLATLDTLAVRVHGERAADVNFIAKGREAQQLAEAGS